MGFTSEGGGVVNVMFPLLDKILPAKLPSFSTARSFKSLSLICTVAQPNGIGGGNRCDYVFPVFLDLFYDFGPDHRSVTLASYVLKNYLDWILPLSPLITKNSIVHHREQQIQIVQIQYQQIILTSSCVLPLGHSSLLKFQGCRNLYQLFPRFCNIQ